MFFIAFFKLVGSRSEGVLGGTELMLFITPHIIANTKGSNFVTEQFQQKLENLRKKVPKNLGSLTSTQKSYSK